MDYIINLISQNPITSISVGFLSLLVIVARAIHWKFVVHPDVGGRKNSENPYGTRHPREKLLESQQIAIESEKGVTLRGWYIKSPNPQRLIVIYHENAGNIGSRLFFINSLINNANANVLIVAYRGFSDSDGDSRPRESEIMRDAVNIFRKAMELSKRDNLPLFVFGCSLGGAASIHFKYGAKGLVIENTFTSICDVVYSFLPRFRITFLWPLVWLITFGSYRSISKIKHIHIPILFVKGRRDGLVPTKHMDALETEFASHKREHESLEVERGTHNDTWYIAGQAYFDRINQFMDQCLKK